MEPSQHSLCRAILRKSRSFGPGWAPRAPASELLWGRGFKVDSGMPSPFLVGLAPSCLHPGLANTQKPFTPWLRRVLRRTNAEASNAASASDEKDVLGNAADVLAFLQKQATLALCTSTSEENGLRIDAVSGFLGSRSIEQKKQYTFAYNMRFTNTGSVPLRVISRQYNFRDASGSVTSQIRQNQPEAAGVVGFTPLMEAGQSFEFGSGVALQTPRGLVTGNFLVMAEPELRGKDLELHQQMEQAELMLRYVYLKGLETSMFHAPLGQLRFDASVPCCSPKLEAAASAEGLPTAGQKNKS